MLVDKENELLQTIEKLANSETKQDQQKKENELLKSKLSALEAYTSDLQSKHDRLVATDVEKTQALNELLQNDLT